MCDIKREGKKRFSYQAALVESTHDKPGSEVRILVETADLCQDCYTNDIGIIIY